MTKQTTPWHPTKEEVERIRLELRPLIRDIARRDQQVIARELFLRRLASVG